MIRLFVILLLLTGMLLVSGQAFAQERVSLRSGSHADYARLVFDWGTLPSYQVHQENSSTLELVFQKEATADIAGVTLGNDPRISGVTQTGQNPFSVKLSMPAGSEYRHFAIGSRLVVDVLGQGPVSTAKGSKPSQPLPKSAPPRTQPEIAKAEPPPMPKSSQKSPTPRTPATQEPKKTPSVKAVKPETVEKTILSEALEGVDPHVITLSSTSATGLAAFIRNDNLWLVTDRSSIQARPEVAGPERSKFAPFERRELEGGVAYTMPLPEGMDLNVYGEGGGLVWRIILTPEKRQREVAELTRHFDGTEVARGGTAVFSLEDMGRVLRIPDPMVGDIIEVVPVGGASEAAGPHREFVDFTLLESPVGMALVSKVDDLQIKLAGEGVAITRPGGLALSRPRDVSRSRIRKEISSSSVRDLPAVTDGASVQRIFDFDRWMMGGITALGDNQRILMSGMVSKDRNGLVEDLLILGKMNIANDRGQEAVGFLRYAEQELPEIAEALQFKALRGAATALSGKHELAVSDLADPALKPFGELALWRAYNFAWLEDWQQAHDEMPDDPTLLFTYPLGLLEKLGLKLAEVALRSGDISLADKILALLEKEKPKLSLETKAGMAYLKGESYRQKGDMAKAKELWFPLVQGDDYLYRAKAGLALTKLELNEKEITLEKAIDRLEGLRYAWRGDELEARINFLLGKLYLNQRQFTKGFSILREATTMSPDGNVGEEITAYMAERFKSLLLDDIELSPMEAVTIYEEFTELTPLGEEGNKLTQKLAERLVEADLLERAAQILRHQVDYRIEGAEQARVALRLAGISLLNREPKEALEALDKSQKYYQGRSDATSQSALRQIILLRARALSEMNQTEEALELLAALEPSSDVYRLKADISWKAGLWVDAAEGLQDLILDEAINPRGEITAEQADLLLNRAVALNLSGNRVALNNMRKRYGEAMTKTGKSRLFDVITRPRQSTLLADRETLNEIVSEVDMFHGFLENYREAGIY